MNEHQNLFVGGGEMGALMRSLDWSRTKLGPPENWPHSLRIALRILLGSGYPMYIAWGPEFTQFYNDGYRPILGKTKHPAALGIGTPETFREIWDFIGPMFHRVLAEGEATTLIDQCLFLDRNGYIEECYYTFSYSPIPHDDPEKVGGVFVTVIEVTERLIEERRLRTLSDLAARTSEARTEQQACKLAAEILENNLQDVPFSLIFLNDAAGDWKLAATSGCAQASGTLFENSAWPLAAEPRENAIVTDLVSRFGKVPLGAWNVPPHSAAVLPVISTGQHHPNAYLVAAINPHKEFDVSYRRFFERVAGQIASSIADAHAYQEERRRAEALARDVTEKKLAQESLKIAHDRLALAQQTANLATWDWNLIDGSITWADSSAPVYGSPVSEMTPIQKCVDRVVEEDRLATMRALQHAIDNRSEYNHEFRVRWPDGSIHWLVGRGRAIYDEAGRPIRVLGINWDITAHKLVEAELSSERRRLIELFQQAPAFIAGLRGPDFVFELTNASYQQLIGNRQVIGKRMRDALPEVQSQGVLHLLQKVYETGEPYVAQGFRLEIDRTPGQPLEERFLDFVYQPVRDSKGQVSGIIALGIDVTERRRAQEALVRSEKLAAVGRLAASIAHEINNPLEAVTNLLYLIENTEYHDETKRYAALADQELKRVSQIATQTLRFHRQSTAPSRTNLSNVVQSLLPLFQGRLSNTGIVIEKSMRATSPVFCLDGEIRQVFSNLIGNAIDAMPNGGYLMIRTRDGYRHSDGRGGVFVTIADTGLGMTPGVKSRLFDAFFTTKQGTGTGLGLWISKGIIDKHDGTIQFRSSQARGAHGTVFRVFLPYEAIIVEAPAHNMAVGF
ncbi:MAG TPA: PAS domain-containing protein [Terriglobales bacterium]|nr:PAS domain-containing protein [Terriglobales bacterium]